MRLISDDEICLVAGGLTLMEEQQAAMQAAMEQAIASAQAAAQAQMQQQLQATLDANNAWLESHPVEVANPLFSIGGINITYTGSLWEGVSKATEDCLTGGGAASMAKDLTIPAANINASAIGCTAGVGAGIIRDLAR